MARQYQEDADEILRTTLVKDVLIAGTVGLVVGLAVFLMFSRVCLHIATPEEVAEAVVFICSDAARHITGVDLPVNGGSAITI